MSITDPDKIDIVAIKPWSSLVNLVITDHLPWDELDEHLRLLQEKINTYLEYIESGEWLEVQMPDFPVAPQPRIVVSALYLPPAAAENILARFAEFLATQSIGFAVEHRPTNANQVVHVQLGRSLAIWRQAPRRPLRIDAREPSGRPRLHP